MCAASSPSGRILTGGEGVIKDRGYNDTCAASNIHCWKHVDIAQAQTTSWNDASPVELTSEELLRERLLSSPLLLEERRFLDTMDGATGRSTTPRLQTNKLE